MNKKQPDLITFGASKNFSKIASTSESEDVISDQAIEKLADKMAELLDEHFALTGEPLSVIISTVSIVAKVSDAISNRGSRPIVITPSSLSKQDELEDDD